MIQRFSGLAVCSHQQTISEGTMEASTVAHSLSSLPPPLPCHGLNRSHLLQRVYHSLSLSDDTCGHRGQSVGRLSTYNPLRLTLPRSTSSPGCWPTPVSCQPGLRTPGLAHQAPRWVGGSAIRRFGGLQPPPNYPRNLLPSCISPSNLSPKPSSPPAS